MKIIELRVTVKDDEDIEEIAEHIKDVIYDDAEDENSPVKEVTYEIREVADDLPIENPLSQFPTEK